jgi:uncharacterized phage protein (TIGR02218 family)
VTYSTKDLSTQDGEPELRFLFTQGATAYRYTNRPYIVSDSNETWLPSSIENTEVNQSNELAKDPVKITLPRDNALALTFLGGSPDEITTLTIFRLHEGTDPVAYWKGRVSGSSISEDAVTLNCENIFTSMRRSGLRARYQKNCRHALYSPQCGVDLATYADAATAVAASGYTVTIELDSGVREDGYYNGGILDDGTGKRYITRHVGTTLTLMQPPRYLITEMDSAGISVTLYPGCNHAISHCQDKFDNLLNYGGFPYIPSKNPFANEITGSVV